MPDTYQERPQMQDIAQICQLCAQFNSFFFLNVHGAFNSKNGHKQFYINLDIDLYLDP